MVDYSKARANMVDSQIRIDDVTVPSLISALRQVPRERFVRPDQAAIAYIGDPIEVAKGRWLLDPRTFAKLAQLAAIQPTDRVLVVGGATGYSAAVLAQLAAEVVVLDSDEALAAQSDENVKALGLTNVKVARGELSAGYADGAPYDVIFLDGAVQTRPDKLLAQLRQDGRLVGIITDKSIGKAHIFTNSSAGLSSRIAFDASVATLPGFAAAPTFQF